MEKYQKINILRIDTEVSEIELRKNWFFQKFKCKISFYNIWEPKMSQLIVIGSHWGFAGCSLVSQWGSLRVIWWSFGGRSVFLKKFNFEFGNKFDYLICHSVVYSPTGQLMVVLIVKHTELIVNLERFGLQVIQNENRKFELY